MKNLLLLSVFFLAFSAHSLKAQAIKAEIWPELQTVIEVSDRIDHNIQKNNSKAIAHFSQTLLHHTEALVKSTAPASFRRHTAEEKKLLGLAQELVEQKNEPETVQTATFEKFHKTLSKVRNTK